MSMYPSISLIKSIGFNDLNHWLFSRLHKDLLLVGKTRNIAVVFICTIQLYTCIDTKFDTIEYNKASLT